MPDPLVLLLATVATYRVAYMVSMEVGPFAAFAHLRGWVDDTWGAQSWQADGINCPLCISFWLALPVAIAISALGAVWLVWLGIAGLVLGIHLWLNK